MRGEKNMTNDIPKDYSKSLLVAFDFEEGDVENCIAIIATKKNDFLDIVHAIQGQDAVDLYFRMIGDRK